MLLKSPSLDPRQCQTAFENIFAPVLWRTRTFIPTRYLCFGELASFISIDAKFVPTVSAQMVIHFCQMVILLAGVCGEQNSQNAYLLQHLIQPYSNAIQVTLSITNQPFDQPSNSHPIQTSRAIAHKFCLSTQYSCSMQFSSPFISCLLIFCSPFLCHALDGSQTPLQLT